MSANCNSPLKMIAGTGNDRWVPSAKLKQVVVGVIVVKRVLVPDG